MNKLIIIGISCSIAIVVSIVVFNSKANLDPQSITNPFISGNCSLVNDTFDYVPVSNDVGIPISFNDVTFVYKGNQTALAVGTGSQRENAILHNDTVFVSNPGKFSLNGTGVDYLYQRDDSESETQCLKNAVCKHVELKEFEVTINGVTTNENILWPPDQWYLPKECSRHVEVIEHQGVSTGPPNYLYAIWWFDGNYTAAVATCNDSSHCPYDSPIYIAKKP